MITEDLLQESLKAGKAVIEAESRALHEAGEHLGDSLAAAINTILNAQGKVILCGMGKSGHIAQKIAATLCSTGTPSVYLHPAEAVHGDLGIYNPGDVTIMLSKSGTTAELMRLIPTLKQFNSPIISIVSNTQSPIADQSDVVLNATISREADPLGLVPTASAIVALALGDALASALMKARGFQKEDFAKLHPAGQLGRNLLFKVADVMRPIDQIACLCPTATLRDVLVKMTEHPQGAACLVDSGNILQGLITDGDIRRILLETPDFASSVAQEVMTTEPITADPDLLLADAALLMEDRPHQISVLPVVEAGTQKVLGLLRIHDIYQSH